MFRAKLSPWAKGGRGNKPAEANGKAADEEEEELDVVPCVLSSRVVADVTRKKLEWELTPEVKLGVRFAEVRLSDLICQNEVVSLEFNGYGKNFITRALRMDRDSLIAQVTASRPMHSSRLRSRPPTSRCAFNAMVD